jgi:hypothetical protein
MPAHHKHKAFIDEYLTTAASAKMAEGPLFSTARDKSGELTDDPVNRVDAYRMVSPADDRGRVQDQARAMCSERLASLRILEAGGSLENAQAMAAHESPTTKLYDSTVDEITLDEDEQITI